MAIVGAGPAGLAAALWARRLGLEACVLERESTIGGQLKSYSMPVVDLPGYEEMSAVQLIERLAGQMDRWGVTTYLNTEVARWKNGQIATRDGRQFHADRVFYAPGLKTRRLCVLGDDAVFSGSVGDLVASSGRGRQVMVVGAGDRGVEAAIRLDDAGWTVTLVSRSFELAARQNYRIKVSRSGVEVLRQAVVTGIERTNDGVAVHLEVADGGGRVWYGREILARIGMEPDVISSLAEVRHDLAYARVLGMTVVGDAALAPWERSLVSAFASSMREVKHYVEGLSG